MIDAGEAERLGLVKRFVPPEKPAEETWAFAQKLLSKSPLAWQMGKQFYRKELMEETESVSY